MPIVLLAEKYKEKKIQFRWALYSVAMLNWYIRYMYNYVSDLSNFFPLYEINQKTPLVLKSLSGKPLHSYLLEVVKKYAKLKNRST